MGFVRQFFLIKVIEEPKNSKVSVETKKLLEDHITVFEELKGLPLARKFDHMIPFKPKVQPICCGFYKSFFVYKGKIKRLVKKMLQSGII